MSFAIGFPIICTLLYASLRWLYDAYTTGIIFVGGRNCRVCYRSFEEAPVSFVFHVVTYIFIATACSTVVFLILQKLKEKFSE